MSKNDDAIPSEYQYEWTPKSQATLPEFLAKYKPSMVQNDGTKPSDHPQEAEGEAAATEEAIAYLSEVTERVQKIQNDDSIPVRANKKKGLKSKKELREEVQEEATKKLKEISVKHGYVSGKWLIFAPPDKVDMIWNAVATSLASGPLSSTSARLAKVATSPQNETPNYSHLLCVYMPDAYDQASVTEVMRVLLRNHGMNLMGVKTNLYTSIGLDSKHPSGVSSTVWKNTALLKDTEIKQLREEYFSELNAAKSAAADEAAAKKAASGAATKAKPKLKKKAAADDPFASDGESADEKEGKDADAGKAKPTKPASGAAKGKKPAPKAKAKAKKAEEAFGSDDDEEGEAARKAEVQAKKKPAPKKRKVQESEEEESEDEAPKKKRGRG